MAKKGEFVKKLKINTPRTLDYSVPVPTNSKERDKLIKRIERTVRQSMEYRDYVQYLKQHVGLDSCIFFQNITNNGKKKRITVEMHHEPFTLYDYVNVVLQKYIDEGLPIDDLDIADEVLELHYTNQVGLVPVSKTAHQMIHNSDKLLVPLNMCYGQYSEFLEKYDKYITDDMDLYYKLEKKMDMTKNLTPESFDAITKEFKYIDVEGFDEVEKMELQNNAEIA